jgi:hypothetical protein
MASFTLSREDVFPNGTSVSAYAVVGEGRTPTSGAPPGSAVSTGTVTSGSVTLSGLADSTKYFAYAASPDRYLRFSTPPPETAQSGGGVDAGAVSLLTRRFVSIGRRGTIYKGPGYDQVDETGKTNKHPMKVVGIERAGQLWFLMGNCGRAGYDALPSGPILVSLAITHPVTGLQVEVPFNGGRTAEIVPNGWALFGPVAVDVWLGDEVVTWTWVRSPSGLTDCPVDWATAWERASVSYDGDARLIVPDDNDELPQHTIYTPMMMLAERPSPLTADVFYIMGDSNPWGQGDVVPDGRGPQGWFERGLNDEFCFVRGAAAGLASGGLTGGCHPMFSLPGVGGTTVLVYALGTNDTMDDPTAFIAGVETQLARAKLDLVGRAKIILCTVGPNASSTDNFATVANQTPNVLDAGRIGVNDLARLGEAPSADKIFDLASYVEVNSAGDFAINGGRTYVDPEGVAYCQQPTDWDGESVVNGTHWSPTGHLAIAAGFRQAVDELLAGDLSITQHPAEPAPPPAAPVNTVAPVVSGEGRVGTSLTTTLGTWTGGASTKVRAWLEDGVVISGQTGATLGPLTEDQVGKVITSRVTASNITATVEEDSSNSIAVVAAPTELDPSDIPAIVDWNEIDLLTGHSDGDTITSLAGEEGVVALLQADSGAPTYETLIVNGKPVLRFDSASLEDPSVTVAQTFDLTLVARLRAITSVSGQQKCLAGLAYPYLGVWYAGNGDRKVSLEMGTRLATSDPGDTEIVDGWHVWRVVASSGSSKIYRDGTIASGDAGATAVSLLRLGDGNPGGYNADMDLAAWYLAGAEMDDQTYSDLRARASVKWGTP